MKKGGLFKTIRVFCVLLVALAIAVALVVMRPKAARQEPVQKGRLVEVFPARPENFQMVVEAFGTVAPRELFDWWSQVIEVPVVAEGGLSETLVRSLAPVTDFLAFGEEIWRADDPAAELTRLAAARG